MPENQEDQKGQEEPKEEYGVIVAMFNLGT
jgi:hypothetical protein